ncbi:MAG: hypothetical protein C0400_19810 [Ralstonia sp.]|nr:hypothetical protein [Ralstonia sp.]
MERVARIWETVARPARLAGPSSGDDHQVVPMATSTRQTSPLQARFLAALVFGRVILCRHAGK